MSDQPNYYAVIPADVRYDNRLPAGAKLMYGEITALSDKKGFCYASNTYFSKLYECTPQAISKWIKLLEKFGYVRISYSGPKGFQVRKVSISVDRTYQQELRGVSTGIEQNNTSINKSYAFDAFWNAYGYKKDRAKCEKKFNSLSQKEKEQIKETLPIYISETCIEETKGKNWKPRRKYPHTYLTQKTWQDYIGREKEKTQTDDLTDTEKAGYEKYLEWIQAEYPETMKAVKFLSAAQYRQYKNAPYRETEQFKYGFLKMAHRRWLMEPEREVYNIWVEKMDQHKAMTV